MIPTKPQSQFVTLPNDVKLHYHALGDSNNPAVLFLQGSGPGASGWLNFRYNAQYFADAGFYVVVPDLPGFGDSEKPDRDYTLDFFVECVLQFATQLDISRFSLVGNSLGGAVSLGIALSVPQRVHHLIVMGCGGLEDQITYFQKMEGIQAMTKVPLGSPEFTPAYLKQVLQLIVHDPAHITDELIEERFRILKTQNPAVFKRMVIPNLTPRLQEIETPILGFWGGQDKFCPISGAETLVTHGKQVQMITLSQCGHWVMIEYPELFNRRCVEFLQGAEA